MDHQSARLKKAFVLAREIGMRDDERSDFATEILQKDISSWKQLDDADTERVLDALHGISAWGHLLISRVRVRVPSEP